jgi:hypothetical protein
MNLSRERDIKHYDITHNMQERFLKNHGPIIDGWAGFFFRKQSEALFSRKGICDFSLAHA